MLGNARWWLMRPHLLVVTVDSVAGRAQLLRKTRSMEAMIDKGEDWMMPLLEFRDFLAATQDPREESRRFANIAVVKGLSR